MYHKTDVVNPYKAHPSKSVPEHDLSAEIVGPSLSGVHSLAAWASSRYFVSLVAAPLTPSVQSPRILYPLMSAPKVAENQQVEWEGTTSGNRRARSTRTLLPPIHRRRNPNISES